MNHSPLQPEDMGTTGLAAWVNDACDMSDFFTRRNRAEDVIAKRYGSWAALVFLRLCSDLLPARRQISRAETTCGFERALALSWAKDLKADFLAGRPCSIKPAPKFKHVLELAHYYATKGIV
jgi:hypothetical protein